VNLDNIEAIQEGESVEDSPGQHSSKFHNPVDTKESAREGSIMVRDVQATQE